MNYICNIRFSTELGKPDVNCCLSDIMAIGYCCLSQNYLNLLNIEIAM